MANKKISQLTTAANVGAGDFFPVAVAAGGSNFITKKAETETVATYVLSPVPSAISQIGFTGTNDVYFDKSNWVDTSAAGGNTHAYLMVNKTDGQLTTGSGIGNPVGGDNMGNCVATTNVNMSNNSITNIASLFFNQTASTVVDEDGSNLVVQAAQDLTVSGIRHVHISGQALDLVNTPISGNVTITGGNLEIDPGNKLIVNEITTYGTNVGGNDPPVIHISGAAAFKSIDATDSSNDIFWSSSNIQYLVSSSASTPAYDFNNVRDGQTLTLYVQNTHASATVTPTFTLLGGATLDYPSPVNILWSLPTGDTAAAMKEPPTLAAGTTNVYTFVNIKTGIFASAVTGYEY